MGQEVRPFAVATPRQVVFEEFALDNWQGLVRAARFLLNDRQLAEDAVQTALMRTFRHWHSAKANPRAYSRAVLVNVCRDQWRYSHRRQEVAIAPDVIQVTAKVSATGPDTVIDHMLLQDALERLSNHEREVLVLRFYLDLSVSDTARLLKVPEGTVKSVTSRAIEKLRRDLSANTNEEVNCPLI